MNPKTKALEKKLDKYIGEPKVSTKIGQRQSFNYERFSELADQVKKIVGEEKAAKDANNSA